MDNLVYFSSRLPYHRMYQMNIIITAMCIVNILKNNHSYCTVLKYENYKSFDSQQMIKRYYCDKSKQLFVSTVSYFVLSLCFHTRL